MNNMPTCREGTVAPITGPILPTTDPLFYTHSQGWRHMLKRKVINTVVCVLWPSKEALLSYAAAFDDTVNIIIGSPGPFKSLSIGHFRATRIRP